MKFRDMRERESHQRIYLQVNADAIMAFAHDGYAREGRGAVVIQLNDTAPAGDNPFVYLSQTTAASSGIGYPDAWTEDRVKAYDPQSEVVVAMVYDDGSVSVHRIRFLDRAAARN